MKAVLPSWSRVRNLLTVYCAISDMVFEAWFWKTIPGACDEEPPGIGSNPWSTTVISLQPRSDSSSAREAPTTPAPMMTTLGPDIRLSYRVGEPDENRYTWLRR